MDAPSAQGQCEPARAKAKESLADGVHQTDVRPGTKESAECLPQRVLRDVRTRRGNETRSASRNQHDCVGVGCGLRGDGGQSVGGGE